MSNLITFWSSARKTVAAVVTSVIGWATIVTESAPTGITAAEWIAGAVLLAGAIGVYAAPNKVA